MTRPLRSTAAWLIVLLSFWAGLTGVSQADQHRATRLGNPTTRFADPLKTPDDLRRTLLNESLQNDVLKVLRLSEYNGDIEDFRQAVANATIKELRIPVGAVLPAMSTRVKGKPELLRNIVWAGKKPIAAYEFSFISGERRYRVVMPKACSNFWVEEQLPRPKHALSLSCDAPAESAQPNLITLCETLTNSGDLTEPMAMLSLPMPAGAKVKCVSGGANTSDNTQLTWKFDNFAPAAKRTVCATFVPLQPGQVIFNSAAVGDRSPSVTSRCETKVSAVPADQLEVVGQSEPVKVGNDVIYAIKARNPSAQPLTNVRITARLESSRQHFVSGSGATPVTAAEEGHVVAGAVAVLNPNEQIEWRIVVKADKAGEARINVDLEADQFFCPVQKTALTVQN
jgi:hypothetical protein